MGFSFSIFRPYVLGTAWDAALRAAARDAFMAERMAAA